MSDFEQFVTGLDAAPEPLRKRLLLETTEFLCEWMVAHDRQEPSAKGDDTERFLHAFLKRVRRDKKRLSDAT